MNQEEFEVLKASSVEAADMTIEATMNLVGKKLGWTHIQIMGVRLLASVIGNKMFVDNCSFDDASKNLFNGLRKECDLVVEEIKDGTRTSFDQ